MSVRPSSSSNGPRRVVLIDFDWRDADLLPELVRRPELSVRLVAGQSAGDPGVRVAELCGLPRTVDLGDLTRELFDLALVGERSTRRTQIEGLLQVLGTPCLTPESFLGGASPDQAQPPAVEASPVLHAAALETSLGGSYDAMLTQAIPDAAVPPEGPSLRPEPAETADASFDAFPSPEDRHGLEAALQQMIHSTGAAAAEVHAAGALDVLERIAQVGADDPLLEQLVALALLLDTPQVVSRLTGPQSGYAWGAWPFHTASHHGVVAAGGIHPVDGWAAWERMVEDLRSRWDQRDREQAAPAFPLVPASRSGWLEPRDFRVRLELAAARHARDGLAFTLHRIELGAESLAALREELPARLRDTDSLCHGRDGALLLLVPDAPAAADVLHGRLRELHREAWRRLGREGEPPEPAEERLELREPEGAAAFLEVASAWIPE